MSGLTLTLREATPYALDMSQLRLDLVNEFSTKEIGSVPLWLGNESHALGELFAFSASPYQGSVVIRDAGDRLYGVGAEMNGGRLVVEGHGGDCLGRGLLSGEIRVEGSCGDYAGAAMHGGTIEIRGNAGDYLGAPLAGERVGIRGGSVLVRGNCGDRAGERQRGGLLLLENDAGDYCGCNMIAGTLVALGRSGNSAGFGMRRGTLLLGNETPSIPCTFNGNGPQTLGFLALLAASLEHLDGPFGRLSERGHRVDRWVGDRGCGGRGEILVWGESQ